jgi:hypothetical protein
MKTNIYQVFGDNQQAYEDHDHHSVVVEAQTEAEAIIKATVPLKEYGCWHDITAKLIFKDVTMKRPKPPTPKCKHCGKTDPI